MHTFSHRAHAGRTLAEAFRQRLARRRHPPGTKAGPTLPAAPDVVLALPRGGVPVAFEVAAAFDAPMEVWVARKIGVPGHAELGMGAIAEGGGRSVQTQIVRALEVDSTDFAAVEQKERAELQRRVQKYRRGADRPLLKDKFVWLVDDGIATGSTLLAAAQGVLAQRPGTLWVGVPVAMQEILDRLPPEIDEIVCPHVPAQLWSVGAFYDDFRQVSDEEVIEFLQRAKARMTQRPRPRPADRNLPRAP